MEGEKEALRRRTGKGNRIQVNWKQEGEHWEQLGVSRELGQGTRAGD